MALRFHPLPLDAFPDEARPALARMNAELRDLFALEGTLRNPLTIQRSDSTVVRKSTDQVHITRITPDIASVVAGVSSVIGVPNLTFSTANTVGTTNTVVSVDSALAIFDTTAPADVATSSAVGTAAFAARRDHAHDVSNIVLNNLATATGAYSLGGNNLTNTGNITANADVTQDIGTQSTRYNNFWTQRIGAISIGPIDTGTVSFENLTIQNVHPDESGVVTTMIFKGVADQLGAIHVASTVTPNAWQTATFNNQLIALEGITSLDELAAAAADYPMGGFGFTNVDDIAGIASDTLELISTDTDEATAEGFRLNWDANVATPTSKARFLTIGYTNDSDVYAEQATLRWNSAFGPCITVEGSIGSFKGFIGYGATFGARTGMLLLDNVIRMRIQDDNAWDMGASELNLLNTTTFTFANNAMVAGSAGPRFSFAPKVQATAGTLLDVLDVDGGTQKFKVEYDGAVIAYESRDVIRYALMGA